MQTIPFGTAVRDVITGQQGLVTGYCTYITGCDQYLIQPPAKDGAHVDGRWVDVARLKSASSFPVSAEIAELAGLDHAATETPRGADIAAPVK